MAFISRMTVFCFLSFFVPLVSYAKIFISGSSSVSPFSSAVAEYYGDLERKNVPRVESIGTGGGFRLLCSIPPTDAGSVDIVDASREIEDQELEACKANGISDLVSFKIGYDGIVIAVSKKTKLDLHKNFNTNLTSQQIYYALFDKVYDDKTKSFVTNFYKEWSDVLGNKNTNFPITFYGPPPTSGVYDTLVNLIGEAEKKLLPKEILSHVHSSDFKTLRKDGRYIDQGDNYNLLLSKVNSSAYAMGIVPFSYFMNKRDMMDAFKIDGVEPLFETIADSSYPLSRYFYLYVSRARLKSNPEIGKFLQIYLSKDVIGSDGLLSALGLIPLPDKDREDQEASLRALSGGV